ncbi:hypothetical protein ACI5FT_11450, partial [Ectothiorhodospira haloalkaliphila]
MQAEQTGIPFAFEDYLALLDYTGRAICCFPDYSTPLFPHRSWLQAECFPGLCPRVEDSWKVNGCGKLG